MVRVLFILSLLLTSFGGVVTAGAYEFSLGFTGGGGVTPYKGIDSKLFALPYASFDSKYVFISFPSSGVHIFKSDLLAVNARVDYLFWEFEPKNSDNWSMRRLDRRKSTLCAGIDASLNTPAGSFKADVTADVLGRSHSVVATGTYAYPLKLAERLMFIPSAGVIWQSAKHNDYYFGVTDKEAYKSGLASYDADSGINYFVRAGFTLAITSHITAEAHGNYMWLAKEVKDSPMVDKTGVWGASGGIVYKF